MGILKRTTIERLNVTCAVADQGGGGILPEVPFLLWELQSKGGGVLSLFKFGGCW